MDSFLAVGPQDEGVVISFLASASNQEGAWRGSREQQWLNVPQFKSALPPDNLEA